MDTAEAFRIVLNELKQISLFCGTYNARNGNEHYMFGVSSVMECIAAKAGDNEFPDLFLTNIINSEKKAKLQKQTDKKKHKKKKKKKRKKS